MYASFIENDKDASTSARLFLGSANKRMSLTLFPPQAGACFVGSNQGIAANTGLALVAGGQPVYFDVRYHGDFIQRELYIIYAAASTPIAFVQAMG